MSANDQSRIRYLDGFRGVAILLVFLFHAIPNWPAGAGSSIYSSFPIARQGWLGVELFFMISGFVIYLTLEKCSGFLEFLKRRWLRLFPAMLIVSIVVFASAPLFSERPAGSPRWIDLLPGLLFVEAQWVERVLRQPVGLLEGAFWSLFLEVKFYAVFGLSFYLLGPKRAKFVLAGIFAVPIIALAASSFAEGGTPVASRLHAISEIQTFKFFGWFLVGVLTYQASRESSSRSAWLAILVGSVSVWLTCSAHRDSIVLGAALLAIFVGAVYSERLKRVFSAPWLLFLGFVSYPFYLVHGNMLVAILRKATRWFPEVPYPLLVAIPLVAILGLAFVIARYLEPGLKSVLLRLPKLWRLDSIKVSEHHQAISPSQEN